MLNTLKNMAAAAAVLMLPYSGAAAATLSVIGPCSDRPVFKAEFEVAASSSSAGEISARIFKESGLPYEGDADGFTSIMGSPTGEGALEFFAPGKMRVYGWCFSVDGVFPQVPPGSFYPGGDAARLTWTYSFSTNENGAWTDSCVPSHTVKAPQFCGPDAARAGGHAPVRGASAAAVTTVFESLVKAAAEQIKRGQP